MAWTQQDTSFKKLQNKRITTSTGKGIDEEKGASSLELYLPDVKTELIPGTPPGSSTSVLAYTGAIGQTLVVDTSVPGNLTYFATTGYGNTTDANNGTFLSESQRLGDWISDKYDGFGTVSGAGYEIKVYDVNSNLITKADPSDWLFDYQTGILIFNTASTTYGAVSSTGPFRVVGYRYTGKKGIIPAYYGGLGYTTYNLGDLFVGAGSTIIKFPLGSNNQVLRIDSTSSTGLTWSAAAASAISTINGLTDPTQIFATGTSGAFFNISSVGSSHTFNIPIAGTGSTGLISTQSQTIAGQKTFTSAIIGDLTGTATTAGFATTANYANVSGYGITSGFATTSEYAYQSGYGITSGFATTSEYSYQAGYAITSGLATTATLALTVSFNNTSVNADYNIPFISGTALSTNNNLYYNPSTGRLNAPIYTGSWAGNTITSFYGGTGFQTYSTGDLLVGAGSTLTKITVGTNNFILVADNTVAGGIKWANASGLAITNINGLTASKQDLAFGYLGTVPEFTSSGSTHTLNIPLAGTGSTGLVSTQAQSFSGIKTFTNAVSITDSTASVSYTSGALTVTGGVGIGGTLNVQGDLNVQGTFTTINSTTITVADKNIELGVVASPSDLTAESGGITLRGATNKSINWYSGVGWSSSESFNLGTSNTFKIGNTNVLSSTSLGTGVTNSSLTALGTISTGVWAGTLITALYGGTGYNSYTKGDVLVGAGNTFIKLNIGADNYVLTASSSAATGLSWLPTAAVGITTLNGINVGTQTLETGTSGAFFNISSVGSSHTLNIPIAGSGSTGLITTLAQTIAGQKTFTSAIIGDLTGTATTAGFAITANYASQSGYAITSGFASTSSYSYQSGYGITSGFATTASYAYQSGYGITSGLATTANYASQSGYAITSGFATTSANVNVYSTSSGIFFPLLSSTTSSAFGISASVNNLFSYNAATGAFGATSINIFSGQSYSIGGNSVLSATSLGTGVTNSSLTALGTISTGVWAGSLITGLYGGTGYNSYTKGDILVGAGSTFIKLNVGANDYVLTANSSSATGLTWSPTAAVGITTLNGINVGTQTLATGTSGAFFNISSIGSSHTFNIPIAGTGATGLVTTLAQSFAGIKTFTNDTVISSSTVSTSTSTGALTVTGGVGIGGSLYTGTSTADNISGVVLNNGVITTGVWAGTLITALYGGTGYNSYTLGDLLVGAGSTFIKLPVGINSYVLGADSSKPSGVGWTTVTPLTVSDTAPASPKNADLWFNSVDGGLLVYYSDVDTNQWVEIALGSGIDLTQPVHITNTTASTSTTTGALIVDGGAGFASTIYAPVISINGIYDQISSTLTTSSTTADQVAMSLGATVYRTLKLNVQMTSSTSYHSQEILMVHDGTLVYMTEYAIVNNGSILSTFDADISGGNIRLLVSPTNAVTIYKIACSAIRI